MCAFKSRNGEDRTQWTLDMMYRQGLQSLTLFWAKVVYFATWFKTKDLIS